MGIFFFLAKAILGRTTEQTSGGHTKCAEIENKRTHFNKTYGTILPYFTCLFEKK